MSYQALHARFHRLNSLREAAGMLHWDMSTMMPKGGATARAEQLATLEVIGHEMLTAPDMAELFEAVDPAAAGLDNWQQANLREMAREWRHATALPADLVEALSRTGNRCEMVWREARPASDFAAVLPALQDLLALVRRAAEAKSDALGLEPYDALLDQYEPGGRAATIEPLFDDLAGFLPEFLQKVLERQAQAGAPLPLEGPFPLAEQESLARRLMAAVGFDFDHGRMDTSLHPFCGGVPDDVRITTRYEEDDFTKALMGVLHETGHAMYERGLPADWRLQPVGQNRGMAIHESQSLLVEMQVCRGPEFLGFLAPLAREAFGGEGPAWQTDNLLKLSNRVERGFIRVDADEVTYPLHVILRFRLERALLAGDLALADLPGAWNDGMEQLLGIRPTEDRLGCLQDIHWYDGAFGYFPTYTLGAMTAAQLFAAAKQAVPEIPEAIGRGDFTPLMTWLRAQVHSQGSQLSADELMTQATGRPLDPEVFKAHLKVRYLD